MLDKSRAIPQFSAWENEYGNHVSIHWYALPDGESKDMWGYTTPNVVQIPKSFKQFATTVYHKNTNSITVSNYNEEYISLADCVRWTVELLKEDDARSFLADIMDIDEFEFSPIWSKQTNKHYS